MRERSTHTGAAHFVDPNSAAMADWGPFKNKPIGTAPDVSFLDNSGKGTTVALVTALAIAGVGSPSAPVVQIKDNPNYFSVSETDVFQKRSTMVPAGNDASTQASYLPLGDQLGLMQRNFASMNQAIETLISRNEAVERSIAALRMSTVNDDAIALPFTVDEAERVLADLDPETAGDEEADLLDRVSEAEISSAVLGLAAERGLAARRGIVRAAAARALASIDSEKAKALLPDFIAKEVNGTVKQVSVSALKLAQLS